MERATFFFYGTLMDVAILGRVAGVPVTAARLRPAVLENYRCVRVAGVHYPAVAPAPGSRVEGRVFRNAPQEVQRRIHLYEEDTYDLRTETIVGPGGIKIDALVYIAGPAMKLTDEAWNFEDWSRTHRRPFLAQLYRYMPGAEVIKRPPRQRSATS